MAAPAFSRRTALGSAVGVGIGLPVLAACGEDAVTGQPGPASPSASASRPSVAPSSAAPATAAPAAGFASTADIPVGGGRIFPDQEVVVTQPQAGTFRCFSSICTHSGCPVSEVTTTIECTCHGSRFALTDGSPTVGPAVEALPEVALTVEGDQLVLS